MESMQIGWLAVVVAAVVNQIIGFLWFSKWGFGQKWLKLRGMREEKKGVGSKALLSFINSLVIAFFISFFEVRLEVLSIADGVLFGFLIWLGFVATTQISGVIWGKKPFELFVINTGYKLLSLLVMGGIIAA